MSNRSRAARTGTNSGAGAQARPSAGAKRKEDPFYLRSISPPLYNAFHSLYKALHAAAADDAIVMGLEEERRQVGVDPEILVVRMKQFQRAAEVVNALRVALEKGLDVSLDEPVRWARSITGVAPPVHPKKKLAPQKDFLIQEVTNRMLALARKAEPTLGQELTLKDAARIFGEEAIALKASGDLRGSMATDRRHEGLIEDLAWTVARLPLDGRSQPALNDLRRGSIASRAAAVARTLVDLSSNSWEDPEILLEHNFRAMGMSDDEAHSFFSYSKKRVKRRGRVAPSS
jgi:hypothetical protein